MSTIKSSSEHLTLNADGASKDIKFQANGVEKASIDSSGNLTVSGGVTTTGARSFFAPASENFGIGVKHVTGGGALYFGASSSSSTPDGGIYNSGGSQILGFGNDRNVTIPAGNLVIGTAGKGIDFSATSDGTTMSSELLDDYEEGTWTPTLSGATMTTQEGSYTKVGNHVHFQARLAWSSGGSGSGFGGLPFTVADGNESKQSMTVVPYINAGLSTIPSGKGYIIGYCSKAETMIYFAWQPISAGVSFASAGNIYFQGSYLT